jgi:hypothetical protein
MSRWGPPEDVTARTAAGGGLACCEHLYPGFERQVQAHPASLPAGALAPSAYRECLDSLWAWLDRSEGVPPQCVTEDHAMAAEHPETEGLFVLATNAVAALCLAREAYERAHAGTNAGRRALNTAGEIAEAAVGPKPLPARRPPSRRANGSRPSGSRPSHTTRWSKRSAPPRPRRSRP